MNYEEQKEQLAREIDDACDDHGCSDKVRKVHRDQYVVRQWDPHPPQGFVDWVAEHGVKAVVAWNSATYRDKYEELKRTLGEAPKRRPPRMQTLAERKEAQAKFHVMVEDLRRKFKAPLTGRRGGGIVKE